MGLASIQLILLFIAIGFSDRISTAISTLKAVNQMLNGQLFSRQYLITYSASINSNICEFQSALLQQQMNHSCSNTSESCPTWFICDHSQSGKCHCGPQDSDGIKCDERMKVSAVLSCYCVTEVNNEMYAGLCFYNCGRLISSKARQIITYRDISNASNLNDNMCGHFKRTGIACGECKPGLSPFVLSYNLSCVKYPNGHKNWWKFVVFGFVPLTLFYFFVVFFNINITSSRLYGFMIFSQAFSAPALVRIMLLATETNPVVSKSVKILSSFYSLWNLDLFRSVFPDICLQVNTLQTFTLDMCIVVYPLLLIIVSYSLIELYDHNVCCMVFLWRPFRSLFRLFRES